MKTLKKIMSIMLVICMMVSVIPAETFADKVKGEGTFSFDESVYEVKKIDSLGEIIKTFALDSNGNPELKDANEVKWIDRVEEMPSYAYDFYLWMAENSDGDKTEDMLINPTTAEVIDGENGQMYVNTIASMYGLQVEFIYPEDASNDEIEEYALEALIEAAQQLINTAYSYIFTVFCAFDRDYAEVFWLLGECPCAYELTEASYMPNGDGTGVVDFGANFYFVLIDKGENTDVRAVQYRDYTAIYEDIENRDSIVAEIAENASGTNEEKARYFNEWLTKNNSYNTSGGLTNVPAASFECISALKGMTGTEGPICEGYSRAFKVLCDYAGVPCVLVNGTSFGEPHMWNYVQLENGKWYAVDVTWNDPYAEGDEKESGLENETYFLVGSSTYIEADGMTFEESHVMDNVVAEGGTAFVNGPVLEKDAYVTCEHANLQFVEAVAPTCTEEGNIAYYECECGKLFADETAETPITNEEDLIVPATGHTYKTATQEPTCTEQGYTIHACECGESYIDNYVDATGHSFGEWIVTTEPTCTELGEEARTCSCGEVETREVEMKDHVYDSEPEFIWSSDSRECTAVFSCSYGCDVTSEVECMVTAESDDATCTTPGTVKFTATAVMNENEYSDSNTVKNVVLDHDIQVAFDWYDDNTVCYAQISCSRCEDIDETLKCDITVVEVEKGIEYVATCEYNTVEYKDTIFELVLPFTDVSENAWYYDEVIYVYEHDLMNGKTTTTFAPNETLTRSMFATILYRAHGEPVVEYEDIFADVAEGKWYSDGIIWAYQNDIVKGYENGLFGINDNISREQLAVMMYRYADMMGYDTTISGDVTVFEDMNRISAWAQDAVAWAVGKGIINGKTETLLDPAGEALRAECAAIIMRFLELYK